MDETPLSLLKKICQPRPAESDWQQFVHLFTPLLLAWGRQQGLQEADALDLTQEILAKLVGLLPDYVRGPDQSFRSWLHRIAVNQAIDFRRRRATRPLPGPAGLLEVPEETVGLLAEDTEYLRALVHRAMAMIRGDFSNETWTAFTRLMIDGCTVQAVADECKMTKTAVNMVRNRVLRRLREVIDGMTE